MAARKLPQLARFAIVKALARDYMPMEVVALIQREFGLTISRQTVEHYDPRKSWQIAKPWEEYFLEELKIYNAELDNIATESHAWRQNQRSNCWTCASNEAMRSWRCASLTRP